MKQNTDTSESDILSEHGRRSRAALALSITNQAFFCVMKPVNSKQVRPPSNPTETKDTGRRPYASSYGGMAEVEESGL